MVCLFIGAVWVLLIKQFFIFFLSFSFSLFFFFLLFFLACERKLFYFLYLFLTCFNFRRAMHRGLCYSWKALICGTTSIILKHIWFRVGRFQENNFVPWITMIMSLRPLLWERTHRARLVHLLPEPNSNGGASVFTVCVIKYSSLFSRTPQKLELLLIKTFLRNYLNWCRCFAHSSKEKASVTCFVLKKII